MIKNVIASVGAAARRLISNWQASLLILGLYLVMLLAAYLFLSTMVATVGQLIINAITVLIVPVIFFVIQGMAVRYMAYDPGADQSRAVPLMISSLKGFWRLVVISIPVFLLAWLLVYLLGKIPASTVAVAHEAVRTTAGTGRAAPRPVPQPTDWRGVAVTALQFLLFGIVLPLAAVNLWIATAREGLGQAIKRAHRTLYKSFAPGPLLIYLIGLLLFGLVPYLLVGMRPPIKGELIEVGQLGVQLLVAAILILFGWILTLGALTQRQNLEAAAK